MTYSGYRVTVPGKLLIAGEYAVLEPKQSAIVIAVNRYITANIEPSSQNLLSLPQFGLDDVTWKVGDFNIHFSPTDNRLNFIQNSIAVVYQYLQEKSVPLHPFHLTVKSELDDPDSGKKYGLGSSAAVVVAVISSMLILNGNRIGKPTLEQIFKLAAIAHLKTQKNGSGVDIAASTFGGWICYSAFDSQWVLTELQQEKSLCTLIEKPWPNLMIAQLIPPERLKLSVGWTRETASTAPMINKVKKFRDLNIEGYRQFLEESSNSVASLIKSFEEKDCSGALLSLTQNRKALRMLSKHAGITIETSKLKDLCTIAEEFGSGKSSGSGGGDCGIAFMKEDGRIEELQKSWKKAGIIPLNLRVSEPGTSVTEYTCKPSLKDHLNSI